jgi:hypothetical protein
MPQKFRTLVLSAMLVAAAASPFIVGQPQALAAPASPDYGQLLQSAQTGDAKAQDALAQYLFDGVGGAPDYKEAFKWSEKAAQKGLAAAQIRLGILYNTGLGMDDSDKQKGFAQLMKAAKQEDAEAMTLVGLAYRGGDGCDSSDAEAFKWLKKAAQKGHARAQYHLGVLYDHGWGVTENNKEAEAWLLKAGKQGIPEAYAALVELFEFEDEAKVARYRRMGAEAGHVPTMTALGLGLVLDAQPAQQQEGQRWLRQAAERGEPGALIALGKALAGECPHDQYNYHEDRSCLPEGLAHNEAEGARILLAAAEAGDARAYVALAHLYGTGKGVRQDRAMAFHWLAMASSNSDFETIALTEIVKGLDDGTYTTARPEDTAGWYMRAAQKGNELGRLRLAGLYERGQGLAQNPLEAAYWYTMVAATGGAEGRMEAKEGMKRVSPTLTPAQHAMLRQRVMGTSYTYF